MNKAIEEGCEEVAALRAIKSRLIDEKKKLENDLARVSFIREGSPWYGLTVGPMQATLETLKRVLGE
ncbi:MAG: hypothetical protein V1819_01950 [bacterium]